MSLQQGLIRALFHEPEVGAHRVTHLAHRHRPSATASDAIVCDHVSQTAVKVQFTRTPKGVVVV
jgi:hypothetical protein